MMFGQVHEEQRQLAERLHVEGYPSVLLVHQEEAFSVSVRHQGADAMLADITDLLAEPNVQREFAFQRLPECVDRWRAYCVIGYADGNTWPICIACKIA